MAWRARIVMAATSASLSQCSRSPRRRHERRGFVAVMFIITPPRCSRRVRSPAFNNVFFSAREAHVPYRATAVALGGMKKTMLFSTFWRGSGGNR